MDGDGPLLAEALFKVVALQHAGHGGIGGQADEVRRVHAAEPAGIEFHHRLFRVQDLEDLALVGLGIGEHLLFRERRPRFATARGVADAPGEVADEEDDRVPQFLKMAHLVHDHRMAEMQVGRRGVKAHLDAQGTARAEFGAQLVLVDDFRGAAPDERHLAVNVRHCRSCRGLDVNRKPFAAATGHAPRRKGRKKMPVAPSPRRNDPAF